MYGQFYVFDLCFEKGHTKAYGIPSAYWSKDCNLNNMAKELADSGDMVRYVRITAQGLDSNRQHDVKNVCR